MPTNNVDTKNLWIVAYSAIYLLRYSIGKLRNLDCAPGLINSEARDHADRMSETIEDKLR